MKCPTCPVDLLISERHGIEIDYCPQCRGVWLDRGELDKILERSTSERRQSRTDGDEDDHDDAPPPHRSPHGQERPSSQYPKKKGSFLSELFDFG